MNLSPNDWFASQFHVIQSSSPSGASGLTDSRCSSQMERLAAREGVLRPEHHARAEAYEAPSNAPKAATDSLECSRIARSIPNDSAADGSDSRDSRSASAPPDRKRGESGDDASLRSAKAYGNVEPSSLDGIATSWDRRSGCRYGVAESIGPAAALQVLQDSMSGFSFKVPLRVIPVSSEVLWTSLDSLRNRLSTDVSGSDFLGRIRAYTGLLGEENRRSARLINGGVR
ncbi:MAG: hypothetical protein RIS79_1652 [Verrucomicrobiota bacterium]|jgi:hypothetical protein